MWDRPMVVEAAEEAGKSAETPEVEGARGQSRLPHYPYSTTSHPYSMPAAPSPLNSALLPGLARSGSLRAGSSGHLARKGALCRRKRSGSAPGTLGEEPPESRLRGPQTDAVQLEHGSVGGRGSGYGSHFGTKHLSNSITLHSLCFLFTLNEKLLSICPALSNERNSVTFEVSETVPRVFYHF